MSIGYWSQAEQKIEARERAVPHTALRWKTVLRVIGKRGDSYGERNNKRNGELAELTSLQELRLRDFSHAQHQLIEASSKCCKAQTGGIELTSMNGKGSVYGDGIATLVQLHWFQ